jgi:hypothetical protein
MGGSSARAFAVHELCFVRSPNEQLYVLSDIARATIGEMELQRTFLFANIFQGERKASVLSLDDSNLSEGTFANDAEQTEMIKVD